MMDELEKMKAEVIIEMSEDDLIRAIDFYFDAANEALKSMNHLSKILQRKLIKKINGAKDENDS